MSNSLTAPTLAKGASETFNSAVILSNWLDQYGTDITIASVGTPVVSGDDAELTISNETANASEYTSRKAGTTHPAGEVILYTVAGGTAGVSYTVSFPITTNDAQTLQVIQPIQVVSNS